MEIDYIKESIYSCDEDLLDEDALEKISRIMNKDEEV